MLPPTAAHRHTESQNLTFRRTAAAVIVLGEHSLNAKDCQWRCFGSEIPVPFASLLNGSVSTTIQAKKKIQKDKTIHFRCQIFLHYTGFFSIHTGYFSLLSWCAQAISTVLCSQHIYGHLSRRSTRKASNLGITIARHARFY